MLADEVVLARRVARQLEELYRVLGVDELVQVSPASLSASEDVFADLGRRDAQLQDEQPPVQVDRRRAGVVRDQEARLGGRVGEQVRPGQGDVLQPRQVEQGPPQVDVLHGAPNALPGGHTGSGEDQRDPGRGGVEAGVGEEHAVLPEALAVIPVTAMIPFASLGTSKSSRRRSSR